MIGSCVSNRPQKCPGISSVSEKEPAFSSMLKSGNLLSVALGSDLKRH